MADPKTNELSEDAPTEAETADVKYIFLDIVGYTSKRSVEAQSAIVEALNKEVKWAVSNISSEVIFLPTGDGMAIAFVNSSNYDVHLLTALRIVQAVAQHNQREKDSMRRFEIRLGIDENVDNVVIDINGKRNVAGNGIAMAQRIMDQSDGMQILVSDNVHNKLCPREKYMKSFRRFNAIGKHEVRFSLYQYVADVPGLNIGVPTGFQPKEVSKPEFTAHLAWYIAESAKHKKFLLSRNTDGFRDPATTVLLHYLARDHIARATARENEEPVIMTWGAELGKSFEEQYKFYEDLDCWVLVHLAGYITERYLATFAELFDASGVGGDYYVFPNTHGISRLKLEFPRIAEAAGVQ
jgi:class 3 adenylate cyclase